MSKNNFVCTLFVYLIIAEDYFIDLLLEIKTIELVLHGISELSISK